jgi:hypothetical protein
MSQVSLFLFFLFFNLTTKNILENLSSPGGLNGDYWNLEQSIDLESEVESCNSDSYASTDEETENIIEENYENTDYYCISLNCKNEIYIYCSTCEDGFCSECVDSNDDWYL